MHTDSVLTVGLGDRAYDIIVGRDCWTALTRSPLFIWPIAM